MTGNLQKTDSTVTVDWQDGSTYVGEIKNGKPHGHGKYTWPDGMSILVGGFMELDMAWVAIPVKWFYLHG